MKLGRTFPDGTCKGPSSKQVGNLDCSGCTRIPRTSRHVADCTRRRLQ
ncbi:hypothetical protein [Streptomyces sp. SLBN-8D4]